MKTPLVLTFALLTACSLHATTIRFNLIGKGGQGLLSSNETGTISGTPGKGGLTGTGITFDDVTKVLTINVGWGATKGFTNLSVNASAAHIHGPTASNFPASYDETASVLISLDAAPFTFTSSASNGGITGSSAALNATNEAALLAGKLYLNVHTATNSGGEIRGNLVPVTETVPASIVVLNNADSGTGSLRQAITDAAAQSGANIITFDPHVFTGGTANVITLTTNNGETAIAFSDSGGLTIDASTAPAGITIDGADNGYNIFKVTGAGSLSLKSLTLTRGNGTYYVDGGAMYFGSGTSGMLDRCTFNNNFADRLGSGGGAGGAIHTDGTLTLTHCTFTGNRAVSSGGAINNTGVLTMKHCTIANNQTSSYGGGIFNRGSTAKLTISQCVISANTLLQTGYGPDVMTDLGGTITFSDKNFVGTAVENSGSTVSGTTPLSGDALLGSLANNGGLTKTLMPQPGSPCIDPSGGATSSTFSTDQRGSARVMDGDGNGSTIVDIGAVEAPVPPTPNEVAFSGATVSFNEDAGTVQVAITRTGNTSSAASVQVTSSPGTATSPADFTAVSTTVSFAAYETSKNVDVTLIAGAVTQEQSETFTLTLSNVSGNDASLGTQTTCTITILDTTVITANEIAFAASARSFNEEAGTVQVTISRAGATSNTASVQVTSSPGTATLADYNAVSTTVNFAANQASATVGVTLLADPLLNEPNESFTLTLSNPSGNGVTLGAQTICTVTIVDASDVTLPTVTLTSPLANAIILEANGPSVNVTGSAKDNQGLSAVEVSLDGGAFTAATLTLSADTKTGTFAKSVNLGSGGAHSIAVRSIDTRGNQSVVVSRSVIHRIVRPLTVSINDSTRGTITTGFVPTSNRNVGERYTVTATPRPGYVFSGWTANSFTGIGVTLLAAELPSLSFVMQDGLNLTANFITNPFISSVIGTFNGLVTPQVGTPNRVDTVGMLQNVRVTSTGTFTSTLRIDGLSLPVNGTFTTTGAARFGSGTTRSTELTLARAGKPSLIVALSLDITGVNGITGTLKQRVRGADIAVSSINARRAAYSSMVPIVSTLGSVVPKPYTVLFPSLTQSPAIGAEFYPQSPGYATMTVSAAGVVNFVGKLADHTIISGSADVITGNAFPLFASLYSGKGVLAGSAQLTDANSSTYDVTAAVPLLWVRPTQASSQWYPDGWSDGIALDVVGARYVVPLAIPAASVFPGLQAINPNATLSFTGGLLASPATFGQSISALNVVINVPLSPTGPTMTITKATGLVTGSLPHNDGTRPLYQGVIMQKGALKGARGYFMSRATP